MSQTNESSNIQNPASPPGKEIPHRPIILPEDVKTEPLDNGMDGVSENRSETSGKSAPSANSTLASPAPASTPTSTNFVNELAPQTEENVTNVRVKSEPQDEINADSAANVAEAVPIPNAPSSTAQSSDLAVGLCTPERSISPNTQTAASSNDILPPPAPATVAPPPARKEPAADALVCQVKEEPHPDNVDKYAGLATPMRYNFPEDEMNTNSAANAAETVTIPNATSSAAQPTDLAAGLCTPERSISPNTQTAASSNDILPPPAHTTVAPPPTRGEPVADAVISRIKEEPQLDDVDRYAGLATPMRYNFPEDEPTLNQNNMLPPPLPSALPKIQATAPADAAIDKIKEEPKNNDKESYLDGMATPMRYNFPDDEGATSISSVLTPTTATPPLPPTSAPPLPAAPAPPLPQAPAPTANSAPPLPPPSMDPPPPHPTLARTVPTQHQNVNHVHEDPETFPDNFFDDLMQNADAISALMSPEREPSPMETAAVKHEPTDAVAQRTTDSEVIPTNFFDDLLHDRVAERLEDAANKDLEIKYSERLRELEILTQAKSKAHKKHKKKKKKSNKRANEESPDATAEHNQAHKRTRRSSKSGSPNPPVLRIRIKKEDLFNYNPDKQRAGSLFPHDAAQPLLLGTQLLNSEVIDLDADADVPSSSESTLPQRLLRVKSEFNLFPENEVADVSLPLQQNELFTRRNRNGLIVDMTAPLGFKRIKLEKDAAPTSKSVAPPPAQQTPKVKRENAIHRAITTIEEFKKPHHTTAKPNTQFIYTSIVRKLPASTSYVTQQIYDNRSPLHTINNVSFKFNSHATHYNLREWGIEPLPRVAAKVAKVLGYDAQTLADKLRTTKLPLSLQKLRKDTIDLSNETTNESCSAFMINTATQTDDVTVLSARRSRGFDIGVQATPYSSSIATQTKEMGATSAAAASAYDDLPLMQHINLLNENQLMALSDFAELIREPTGNAMDAYRLRQRMAEIYNCSQLPSSVEANKQNAARRAQPPLPLTNYAEVQQTHVTPPQPHPHAHAQAAHYPKRAAALVVPQPSAAAVTHPVAGYPQQSVYHHVPEQYVPQPVPPVYASPQHHVRKAIPRDPRYQPQPQPHQQPQAPTRPPAGMYYGRGNMRR